MCSAFVFSTRAAVRARAHADRGRSRAPLCVRVTAAIRDLRERARLSRYPGAFAVLDALRAFCILWRESYFREILRSANYNRMERAFCRRLVFACRVIVLIHIFVFATASCYPNDIEQHTLHFVIKLNHVLALISSIKPAKREALFRCAKCHLLIQRLYIRS